MKKEIVSDDMAKALKIYEDNIRDCKEAVRLAGEHAGEYRKAYWNMLYLEYPDIPKNASATYNSETKELIYQDNIDILKESIDKFKREIDKTSVELNP